MTETLGKLIRITLVAAIALAGLFMALVFVASAAIAVGVMFLIAKVRGKPFVAADLFTTLSRGGFQRSQGFTFRTGAQTQSQEAARGGAANDAGNARRPRPAVRMDRSKVTDVEARDVA
jgi:hypothetical protein